jgi:hypothetical protein
VEQTTKTTILTDLDTLERDAKAYFKTAAGSITAEDYHQYLPHESRFFWEKIPNDVQAQAESLVPRVLAFAPVIAEAARLTPFLTSADQKDIGVAIKKMRAALYLRQYEHWDTEVIHDEGTILGVQPARQAEQFGLYPAEADKVFQECVGSLRRIVELANPAPMGFSVKETISRAELVAGYRPGTAFIMMWMDPDRPGLDDIVDTVKRCFGAFDIQATRADDIQHEDLITTRILEEIRTAEFLFADLTEERPSVYYKVGYAHAIGRRVILFRKKDTKIHFDLAGYNCPEYSSLRELQKSLMKRLCHVTGRQQRSE